MTENKNKSQVVEIGENPFDRGRMIEALDEYAALHESRPVKDNSGGMRAPHMFAAWYTAKLLAPEVIIESGIWKGQSTWLFEQACPSAEIHSIDLNLDKREFVSERVNYHEEDFTEVDWSGVDRSRALCFFDDHQNAYSRLQQAQWLGFKDIIFEDNPPPGGGDFYSMKMIFDHTGFGAERGKTSGGEYKKLSSKIIRKLKTVLPGLSSTVIPQFSRDMVRPNNFDEVVVKENSEIYREFPPVFENPGFPAPEPLFSSDPEGKYELFKREASFYNGFCYVRLK